MSNNVSHQQLQERTIPAAGGMVVTAPATGSSNGLQELTAPASHRIRTSEGSQNLIVEEALVKVYKTGKTEVRALDGLDLTVEEGTECRGWAFGLDSR